MPAPPPRPLYRAPSTRREGGPARVLVALLLGAALSGCGVSLPLATLAPPTGEVLTTGSITPPPTLGLAPGSEDWRRARAALVTALDPQGNGAAVSWDNPETGAAGTIAAADLPYLEGDIVCRRFSARTRLDQSDKSFEGHACRVAAGEWRIRSAEPGA